jgi:hypothetical protein
VTTVPKSRVRKKTVYSRPQQATTQTVKRKRKQSAPWVAPAAVGLLLLGVAWLAVYYVSLSNMPVIGHLGPWNLAIGFGLLIAGLLTLTQWK